MRLKMMMICCVGLLLLLTVVPTVTHAEVPDRINYQGFLTDSDGNPVPDDIYEMVFNLHTTEDGDTGVWQQTSSAVSIVDGIYNVELGPFVYPGQVFDGDLYLEVEVNGEIFAPRQRLVATPYAMKAAFADEADSVADGAITSVMLASGAVDADKVADNAITSAKIADNTITAVDIQGGSGSGLDADKLDGISSEFFLLAGSDFGRSGVSSTLYEGTTALTNKYVGKSGSQTITSGNLTVNTVGIGTTSVTAVKGTATSPTYGSGVSGGATGSDAHGVQGEATGANGAGVYGYATGYDGIGSYGSSSGASGEGIHGVASGNYGYGVVGEATYTGGTTVVGGHFTAHSTNGRGVYGESKGATGRGVFGWATATGGDVQNHGGYFIADGGKGIGVHGEGPYIGGAFFAVGPGGTSVYAYSDDDAGKSVWGYNLHGEAGHFTGDVSVSGNLSKGGGSFIIDHPLYPEHKFLRHSFVESPDMMNVYNGNVVLDEKGEAWVELPEWFEALNKDFRYQLTCIGGFAQVYIAKKVFDNRFMIAGGTPGLEVSWQVTGIRHDAWAEAHRIVVEEDKSEQEQGSYLHPELYGKSEEQSFEWARNPEIMQKLKKEKEISHESKKPSEG